MKYEKRERIKMVDGNTAADFETKVNAALDALEAEGKVITGREYEIGTLRALIRYETRVLIPENDFERRMMAGEKLACTTCTHCQTFEDKRKSPRCLLHGFRRKQTAGCEKYRERREEDGERVPAREAG